MCAYVQAMTSHPDINLASLPSLPLSQRNRLPFCPAIYFALDSKDRVLYIGRAVNLVERWKDHHRLDQLTRIHKRSPVRLLWLDCSGNIGQLATWETYYISFFKPLLNSTPVPPKKITPAEIALQETLNKISKYSIIFGIAPESSLHSLPTINIRYFGNGRVPHTLRRIFKASNKKPTSLQWTEFVRRKWSPWWRTRCNGIAIELAPWSRFSEEDKQIVENLTIQSLAGVGLFTLQPYQLTELIEKYPYLRENHPDITALKSDPIRLIWTPKDQEIKLEATEPTLLKSLHRVEETMMQSEPESAQIDDSNELGFRKMKRKFLSVEGVEVEICIDCLTERLFTRHNLFWKICFNRMSPDFERNRVIENLKEYANIHLPTIRWTGFDFKIERVYFIEDDMETDAVLLPLAMFEDLMRYEYRKRATIPQQENDFMKLGKWLEQNTISQLLNNPG